MTTNVYSVPRIRCEGCAETITTALSGVGGVQSVQVDVPTRKVTATYDEAVTSDTALREVLDESGYPAE